LRTRGAPSRSVANRAACPARSTLDAADAAKAVDAAKAADAADAAGEPAPAQRAGDSTVRERRGLAADPRPTPAPVRIKMLRRDRGLRVMAGGM